VSPGLGKLTRWKCVFKYSMNRKKDKGSASCLTRSRYSKSIVSTLKADTREKKNTIVRTVKQTAPGETHIGKKNTTQDGRDLEVGKVEGLERAVAKCPQAAKGACAAPGYYSEDVVRVGHESA
jgi:hypothetical protein